MLHLCEYEYIPDRTAWREDIIYDIEKLWQLTKEEKGQDIDIDRLKWVMDVDHWSNLDGIRTENLTKEHILYEKYITANQVINDPLMFKHHYDLIQSADLSYPILVIILENDQMDIIDGIHRISKAHILQHKFIKAIVVSNDTLKQAVVKKKK